MNVTAEPLNPRRELFEFVLDQAETQPSEKRARLYRALAEFAGDPKVTAQLQELAATIEHANDICLELALVFAPPPLPPLPQGQSPNH